MKHTPLPWSIGGDGADIFGPDSSDNKHIADCQDDPGLLGMAVEDQDNAQFIAKACNSHHDLLEALKELKYASTLMLGMKPVRNLDEIFARVDTAIKKAT